MHHISYHLFALISVGDILGYFTLMLNAFSHHVAHTVLNSLMAHFLFSTLILASIGLLWGLAVWVNHKLRQARFNRAVARHYPESDGE